jgi:hypothetical protein
MKGLDRDILMFEYLVHDTKDIEVIVIESFSLFLES